MTLLKEIHKMNFMIILAFRSFGKWAPVLFWVDHFSSSAEAK